jgi:predicted Fe-Mo cluster-binding NifX family protein
MKAAFSVWNARIAPVFDTARLVHIVEAESGRLVGESDETLPGDLPAQQVTRLAELGVGTLVCGAISWPLHGMVMAAGIEVIPFITGTVSEVMQAWLRGTMGQRHFAMPGCHRRRGPVADIAGADSVPARRHGRGGAGFGGSKRGGGRGQHPGGPGRGRRGGPGAGGAGGDCVCAACGHRESHERGVACAHRVCPVCGAPTTWEV